VISSNNLTPGNWYYISVDNRSGTGYRGTFSLCIDDAVDYDYKSAAIEITDLDIWCSADAQYSTMWATGDEDAGSCWVNGPNYNRWFKFQATTANITIDVQTGGTQGNAQYLQTALWDATGNELACAIYTYYHSDLTMNSVSLTPGEWYYISVDNRSGLGYRGSFTLCLDDAVDYDYKSAAIELTDLDNWCSADAQYSTMWATGDEDAGSCWVNGPNYNRWFKFQATTNNITVDVKTGGSEGSAQYLQTALWDDTGNELACAVYTYYHSDLTMNSVSLIPGEWYYISVDNRSGLGYRGSFTLCLDDAVDYDYKSAAIEITDLDNWCSADAEYSTMWASGDEDAGSCWVNGPNYNRWFKFQATTTNITIDVKTGGSQGSAQYLMTALWDDAGNEVACAVYTYYHSDLTMNSVSLTPGEWYYISVDNRKGSGYRGSFTLCVDDAVDYDFKSAAIELTDLDNWCSADAQYSTLWATGDEDAGSCWVNGPNYNRWFKFQATTGHITIDVKTGGSQGNAQYLQTALWDDAGNELACAVYTYYYSDLTMNSISLTPGEWYYISVDNRFGNGYRGSFSLCIDDAVDYDYKVAAIELTDLDEWCSADAQYSTLWATGDEDAGSCWVNGPNYNRWFKFQATTAHVTVDVKTGGSQGNAQYLQTALWDETGNELACAVYTYYYSDLTMNSVSLTPGEWYYISVDNRYGNGYRGTFTLCIDDAVDYDYKSAAIELTDLDNWCSSDAQYSTLWATGDEDAGSCWVNGPNYNRWFKFQATTPHITIDVKTGGSQGNAQYLQAALWDATGTEMACAVYTYYYSDLTMNSISLTPGEWYYISVDNRYGNGYRGSFTLCVDDAVDYDYKEAAIELTDLDNWCSSDAQYSTLWATGDEDAGSCWVNGPNYNRWFKFQATTTNVTVEVKTGGSQGNAQYLQSALWDEAGNEEACAVYTYYHSDLTMNSASLTPGEWYYISVDNRYGNGYRGSFTLCISDGLDYDYKEAAIELVEFDNWESPPQAYSTLWATPDEDMGSCWVNGPNNNRWFKFQAISPNVEILCRTGGSEGTIQYPMMTLWDELDNELACDVYTYYHSDLSITYNSLVPGEWYYVSVDNRYGNGYRGSFSLSVNDWNRVWEGTVSQEWTNDNNWNVGTPTLTDNVYIPESTPFEPIVSDDVSCYNASLEPNATLTINSGNSLTIAGSFTIKSDASGTGSVLDNGTLNVAGTTTFQKHYSGFAWHYISSPVATAVSGMFMGIYLKEWDEPSGTFNYIEPVNVPLTPGKGFAVWSSLATDNLSEFVGTLNTGAQALALTNSGPPLNSNGWNFMGNPYPSSIDWDAVSLPATIDGGFWVYDPVITDYRYYLPGGGSNTTSQYIAPTQGFFLHCNDAGGGTLNLENDDRVHSSQTAYKESVATENSLIIGVEGFETSVIEIRFLPEASESFDTRLDLFKLFGNNGSIPAIYSISADGDLAINSMPELLDHRIIPLGLEYNEDNNLTLNFSGTSSFDPEISIYLEDRLNNTLTNLKTKNAYTFNPTGENEERFFIHFKTEGINGDESFVNIYSSAANIYLVFEEAYDNEQVSIYNLNGQELDVKQFNNESFVVMPTKLIPGIYIVRVIADGKLEQKKVFIN